MKLLIYLVPVLLWTSGAAGQQHQARPRYRHTDENSLDHRRYRGNTRQLFQEAAPATWGAWVGSEPCSVPCGGDGFQTQTRECSTGTVSDCEVHGGHSWQVAVCNEGPCSFAWSQWGPVSECSISCGGTGYAERKRTCSTGDVKDCERGGGTYWEVMNCDNGACAFWTEWGPWASCSKTCDVGARSAFRNCTTGNNDDCKRMSTEPGSNYYRLEVCQPGPSCTTTTATTTTTTTTTTTAEPAVWGAWHDYIPCSKTCGPGFGQRKRDCSSGNVADCVTASEKDWMVFVCNLGTCAVDGVWTQWTSWKSCPVTCGTGQVSRARMCIYIDPNNKGAPCEGGTRETKDCATNTCPVDGTWGDWTAFSTCSVTCDDGQRSRSRTCQFPSGVPRGNNCTGSAVDTQACTDSICPIDGHWSEWSVFSRCSSTCGTAIKFRGRTCMYDDPDRPKGEGCAGVILDRQMCKQDECPVDGVWTEWDSWSRCSHTCNGGKQAHVRACSFDPTAPHGEDCQGQSFEFKDCGQRECPVNGTWTNWTPWTTCTKTCGTGRTTRLRSCEYRSINPSTPRGQPCDGEASDQKTCNENLCPVDARWSTWSRFGDCSVTCGGGARTRTRTCTYDLVAPMGRNCTGLDTDQEECSKNDCPIDGQLLSWREWSVCPVTCEGGTHSRSRDCYFPPGKPHGKDCTEPLSETETCNDSPCPTTTTSSTTTAAPHVPGHWSDWEAWSICTRSCGAGTQARYRKCAYPDQALHGEKCPGKTKENRDCNTDHCPVDGQWGSWSSYSRCSVSCGNGTYTRNRTCEFDARFPKGETCTGENKQSDTCNAGECPVDGVWADWGEWSSCPVTCGGSVKERTRICYFPLHSSHGLPCGDDSHENATCGSEDCPVDGVLTSWGEWSNCTCEGTKDRYRDCYFEPGKPHGLDCHGELYQNATCHDDSCTVNGEWSDWNDWTSCTKSCGGGKSTRKRTCVFQGVAPNGRDCPGSDLEARVCNNSHCPVDGNWNSWDVWSKCSATCGDGTHTRTRVCLFDPQSPQGSDCKGDNSETQPCSDGICPENGIWGSWGTWSTCTVTCGNGTSTRNRSCDYTDGVPRGADCVGSREEITDCSPNMCPVDGFFSEWSEWTGCDLTCGGGHMSRTRYCVFPQDVPHGEGCIGLFNDSMTCNPQNCPVDGFWSAWSNMTACSLSCGGGSQFRARQCEFQADSPHGANCTGLASETQQCNTQLCAVDAQLSEWGNWAVCSASCEGGTQTRTRTCNFPPDPIPHGADCTDPLQETKDCNVEKCPINGKWSEWSPYGSCSLSCEGGIQHRNRTCLLDKDAPSGSGCFGDDVQNRTCNEQPCPVDGTWGEWNAWHECSVSCGGGKMVRDRTCTFPDGIDHGQDCVGTNSDIADCGMELCPVDGFLGEWSAWTECSHTCGDGERLRARRCLFKTGVPHGANCTGNTEESIVCSNGTCPVSGVWTEWGDYNNCSVSCGGGTKTRNRTCIYDDSAPRGEECKGKDTSSVPCSSSPCPVDGSWGDWSKFSKCSQTCGNGTLTRNRTCEYLPVDYPHGRPCDGNNEETQPCVQSPCPVDAVLSAWSDWTTCNASCGGGMHSRNRTCTWPTPEHGADCTGPLSETKSCNDDSCAVDGVWGDWGNWSTCSKTCNYGQVSRIRECLYDPVAPRGAICPGFNHEEQFCKLEFCPVDGTWAPWTEYGVCSTTCGAGTETRTRFCVYAIPAAPHGKECAGNLTEESRPCSNVTECPVDGVWSAWSEWGACSTTCGHGDQLRTRTCTFDPVKPRGFDCSGQSNETKACDGNTCPVDGVWESWSRWNHCSATCGGGDHVRRRSCYFPPRVPNGDYCVGKGSERATCNNDTCPVDGVFGPWSDWTTCSASCAGGTQSRSRNCTYQEGAPRGKDCHGHATDSQNCNTNKCPATTASPPLTERTCNQCFGSVLVCESYYVPMPCPDKHQQYCINEITNYKNATRIVNRRCGTQEECYKGWFQKYSTDEKCMSFNETNIYTDSFYCEYCCDSDGCNAPIHMPHPYHP